MKKQLVSLCLMLLAFTSKSQTTWATTLNSGAAGPKFGLSTYHSLGFYTNNALRATISKEGRFGIGTSDPHVEFEVVGKGMFSGDISTGSAILIKDNLRIDHIIGTPGVAANIISFRPGTGSGVGVLSPLDFTSLCDVNYPYEQPNTGGPMNNNRVAFGAQTANLFSNIIQISDPAQNAVLSTAVSNGDGIIALEPLNGYAGVGGSRALKINPGCPVDVNICEGGGYTRVFTGMDVRRGLKVFDYGIKAYTNIENDVAFTVLTRDPTPMTPIETFRIYGTGNTEIACRGASFGGTVLNINEVSANQTMNLINASSGSGGSLQNVFTVKANGETTIKSASAAGLALKVKNSTADVLSLYGNGYTELKVNSLTTLPSDRVLAIKDMVNNRDLFVVKKDGKVLAREVEITNLATFPDYVFDDGYNLKSISEVENFITKNKHLPGFEKGKHYEENGINVSDLLVKQQEKLEEQMLYIIQLEKRLQALEKGK